MYYQMNSTAQVFSAAARARGGLGLLEFTWTGGRRLPSVVTSQSQLPVTAPSHSSQSQLPVTPPSHIRLLDDMVSQPKAGSWPVGPLRLENPG